MIDIALFLFGLLVTSCVGVFIGVTRSEFKKMEAHPERYPMYLKDSFPAYKAEKDKTPRPESA